jgi:hypothetical protein
MPTPQKEPLHFGRPTLKDRGWTDALIARFLGEPDLLAPNPHYRSQPPRKLYLIARVEAVEETDAFRIALAASAPRKRAAAGAVATKRRKMERHVERVRFAVPLIGRDELVRLACRHYNERQADRAMERDWYGSRSDYRPATPESSPAFLERICTNYLRHRATAYDERLDEVAGKVGVGPAYQAIVAKVLDAIAESHPWLAAECGRQKAARVG